MMIELAPRHKIGLPLASPVLIAAGFGGYGDAYQRWLDLSVFGAVVTRPVTLRPERGSAGPRVAESGGGMVIDTGRQNPGVKKVLQQYGRVWRRLPCPVLAHLPADEPDSLRRTARALSSSTALAGLELGLPAAALPVDAAEWVLALRDGSDLPLLAKIPLDAPLDLAETVVEAGIDALVIGAAPTGAAEVGLPPAATIHGHFFGPAMFPLTLHRVHLLRTEFDVPLVAAGGVQSLAQAQMLLQAGASAVQLDSLLFVEPLRAEEIARAMAIRKD